LLLAPSIRRGRVLEFPRGLLRIGIFMSDEVSYFSRFFVKFVEIIAAGLASAISAYLLAHFAGLLSSPTPPSPPALTARQVSPAANGVTAQTTPPAAAAAANEHPAPQDGAEPKLAPKGSKDAKVLPPRNHTKTDTSVAAKEPRNQKSAEAVVRTALANFDANRQVPADAVIGPGLTDTRLVPVDSVPSHQPDVQSRPVDVPPRRASEPTPNAASALLQPVQAPPGPGADLRPRSPEIRPTRPGASPVEIAAPQPPPPADQDKQVRAGVLTCDVSAGMGLILGSQKLLSCSFSPEGAGRREDYDGSFTKFGLDLGLTMGGFVVWSVFTNTVAGPGFLAGDYVGASGEVTVAAGLGANVLVGGSNRTVALQPISLGGQTGLNLAIGVAALHLGLPRQ
jgi:hypothetical protein